jgi:hypothetical protein
MALALTAATVNSDRAMSMCRPVRNIERDTRPYIRANPPPWQAMAEADRYLDSRDDEVDSL